MRKLVDLKELLYTDAYHRVEIDRYLDPQNPAILKFDPELGYLHRSQWLKDGMDGGRTASTMDPKYGHRTMINYADQPCRINTYGDSYTLCAQVGDAETWQEVLAGHFREPIRNFGVGGYGVYQAYRRAMRMEAIKEIGSEYIILNIWDDDYKRNLDAARWIRCGWMLRDLPRGLKDGYPVHGFPWAHVRYNVDTSEWEERPGACKTAQDLLEYVGKRNFYNKFKDDQMAQLYCLAEGGDAPLEQSEAVAAALGIKVNLRNRRTRPAEARRLHQAYGIKSTMYVVDKFRKWCEANDKKLMVLLSYDVPTVNRYIKDGSRFDSTFVRFLKKENYTFVDTLPKFKAEYKQFNGSVMRFCDKHYVERLGAQVFGHFNPLGYFWLAFAIRREIRDWLDPKPLTYRD